LAQAILSVRGGLHLNAFFCWILVLLPLLVSTADKLSQWRSTFTRHRQNFDNMAAARQATRQMLW
jgi:hypothetical protein